MVKVWVEYLCDSYVYVLNCVRSMSVCVLYYSSSFVLPHKELINKKLTN